MKIPKKLHLVWVGDDDQRPEGCIQSWRDRHPDWEFRLWGNADCSNIAWTCRRQLELFRSVGAWEGVADIMRYEILYRHGGVYVDADSICLRPLDDHLLEHEMFAVWESERWAPGLIANGFIGSVAGHAVLGEIIARIARMDSPHYRQVWGGLRRKRLGAWKSVGPVLFTEVVRGCEKQSVTILPSLLFIPRHYRDKQDRAPDPEQTYACHRWGSKASKRKYRRRLGL